MTADPNSSQPAKSPQIPNPAPLGARQWEELARSNPADVCRRSLASWDETGFYSLPFMGTVFRIYPAQCLLESTSGDSRPDNPEFRLMILCYLLYAQNLPQQSRWVSEKEIKGGSMFFKGPHALPAAPVIKLFGNDPQGFIEAGKRAGGVQLPGYGDAALAFPALPRIQVACVLWAEDDEFPARASFLFDASIEAHLPLDIISAMVRFVVKVITSNNSPLK